MKTKNLVNTAGLVVAMTASSPGNASNLIVYDSTTHMITNDTDVVRKTYDVPDNNATLNIVSETGIKNLSITAGMGEDERRHITHIMGQSIEPRNNFIENLAIDNMKDNNDVTTIGNLRISQTTITAGTLYIRRDAEIDNVNGGIGAQARKEIIITNEGTINTLKEIDSKFKVTNNITGVIESNMHVTSLTNRGTIVPAGWGETMHVGELLNLRTGTITAGRVESQKIINSGTIYVSEGIKLFQDRENEEPTIENYGGIIIRDAETIRGDTGVEKIKINNYGLLYGEGTEDSPIILITSGSGSTEINNYGEIRNGGYGLAIADLDGKSITINNGGKIHGGIGTPVDSKIPQGMYISINNLEGGEWESEFVTPEALGGEPLVIKTVKNDGVIRTLKTDNGAIGTLNTEQIENNGVIDITNSRLVINGDYIADEKSSIETGAALGGDNTAIPTLTINGKASGSTTKVRVKNIGGEGGTTVEGILVVEANNDTGGGFTKDGRIVAGTYDYDLVKYETQGHTEWRLISTTEPGPTPGPTPKPVHKFRPEAIAYAENLRQDNILFMTDSDQRRAVDGYTDPVTGRTETSSLWLSQTGGHSTRHDASSQLKSDYNRYVMQLGGTVLSLPAGDDGRLEAGIQAGYGHARGESRSALTGYRARGTVSGYSTGIYSTWRQHREGLSGAYVSTTLQYSWLKNQVKGDDLAAEKYDARGTTLSLEGGYDLAVWQGGEQNGDSLFIRPRAQVTRMGVKADEHREANGTRVSQQGDGNVFSRTGVRVWLDKAVTKTQRVQPFVEADWLHNTRDFCSSMDGVRDCQAGNRDQAEVLAGVTGDVSRNVAVTAQAGGQFGSQASRDLAGTLNVSVKF